MVFETIAFTRFRHPGRVTSLTSGSMSEKRPHWVRRFMSLGVLVAVIAAFRKRKLAREEAKFGN
jgi:hypothetical protein